MFRAIFIFFVKIDRKYFLLRSYYIIEAICDMITEKTGKYRHILCMYDSFIIQCKVALLYSLL